MNIENAPNRSLDKGQRGAALITVLLMSTLLLATGGALVLVTSLSNRTAIDATAEMQAYYSAEAGVQDTINVLRGNVNPQTGMPANSKIDFRKAVTPSASNRSSDHSGLRRLSGWLDYSYTAANGDLRVPLTANYSPLNGLAYSVEVSDPDNIPVATGEPNRLLIRVRGYGPKGAEKRLETIIRRTRFDYTPPAMLMIRGADDCSPATFTAGDSAAKRYSGHDNRPTGTILPAFGATCPVDMTTETNADTKDTVAAPKAANFPMTTMPEYLQTTDGPTGARAFLAERLAEVEPDHYFTSYSGAPTGYTFVDGNCTLDDGGSGLLIVTGRLTMNGNPNFDGLILVLGEGYVERNGAGNGEFHGAMAVARFNRTSGPFLAPTFITDGAGTSAMQYDSDALRRALNNSGPRVLGIHEY